MTVRYRVWVLCLIAALAAILIVDWGLATARLDDIIIESWVDPPSVVADGKSSTIITIRVTENGEPRARDLVQLWLGRGGGILTPMWVFTDENGMAEIEYRPNPYSSYDPQEGAEVQIKDISIGRLAEVGKRHQVEIPLLKPED